MEGTLIPLFKREILDPFPIPKHPTESLSFCSPAFIEHYIGSLMLHNKA